MQFDIVGWAPRYGLSLEFLLSLHIGTMAPDLVYAMLQNFDTEIQVYLDDAGDSEVQAKYVDPLASSIGEGFKMQDVKKCLDELDGLTDGVASDLANSTDWGSWVNGLLLTKRRCQYLLENLEITSPPNCTGTSQEYVIVDSTNDTDTFLGAENISSVFAQYGLFDDSRFDIESVYENYSVTTPDGKKIDKFDAKNCAESYGVPTNESQRAIILDDTCTWLMDTANQYGFNEAKDKTVDNIIIQENSSQVPVSQNPNTGEYIYSNYRYKKVKQHRIWIYEVSGEEVEFEWITYKYLIYDSSDKWVDTIVWEYIVREKTTKELIDDGVLNENGEKQEENLCSNHRGASRCCKNCQDYVKAVIAALADIEDSKYATYTPYIARVVGSWFRDTYFIIPEGPNTDVAIREYKDGYTQGTKIVNSEGNGNSLRAVYSPAHNDSNISSAWGADKELIKVDEEYLADSKEYWTKYEMKKDENGNDTSEYQLYYLEPNGSTSNTTAEDFIKDNGYASIKEAEEDGHAFVKKAQTIKVGELENNPDIELADGLLWSAYSFKSDGAGTGWKRIEPQEASRKVSEVYNIVGIEERDDDEDEEEPEDSEIDEDDEDEEESRGIKDSAGFFYNILTTNSVTQLEDAQRSQTNSIIKNLFKYRKYYIYDGTEMTSLRIAEDKNKVLKAVREYLSNKYGSNWANHVSSELLGKYGRSALRQAYGLFVFNAGSTEEDELDIASSWLEWQLDMYYSKNNNGYTGEVIDDNTEWEIIDEDGKVNIRKGDPRDPNLVSQVNIEKSSLNAFSILENTGTIDADYQYRDFKELIVELDYFDKEDLSSKAEEVFSWILPESEILGWPVRQYDKQNMDYGSLIHSTATYKYLKEKDGVDNEEDNTDIENPGVEENPTDTETNNPGNTEPADNPNDITTENPNDVTTEDDNENSESKVVEFKGYKPGDLVASPVTGKVIEYGKHKRTNIYTNQEEEVGYIVIEPITEAYFTDDMVSNNSKDTEGIGNKESADGLNLFYKEYDGVCAGYTIMIDGLDVDLSATDSDGKNGIYEKNEVMALYNSKEQTKREAEEKAKLEAPFFVNFGESDSLPSEYISEVGKTGYYVKEGKYIGKTVGVVFEEDENDNETTTENTTEGGITTSVGAPIEDENEVSTNEVNINEDNPAEYIRILMKDTDYSIVENIEDYFLIPEQEVSKKSESQAFNAFGSEVTTEEIEMLAAVLVAENGASAETMTAVCQVIKNRGNDKVHFSNVSTIADILTQNTQYGTVFPVGNNNDSNHQGGYGTAPNGSYTRVYDLGKYGKFVVGNQEGRNGTKFTERFATEESKQIVEGVLSGSIADEASARIGKLALYQVTAEDYPNHDSHAVVIGELYAHTWSCIEGRRHIECGCMLP